MPISRHLMELLPRAVDGTEARASQQRVPHDTLDLFAGLGPLDVAYQVVELSWFSLSTLKDLDGLRLGLIQGESLEMELVSVHGLALEHEDSAVTGQDAVSVGVVVRGEDSVLEEGIDAYALAVVVDHVSHELIQRSLFEIVQTTLVAIDQRRCPMNRKGELDRLHDFTL